MISRAAEILASSLEQCASAQDRGELTVADFRIDEVRRDVLPMNDIPRPIFKLAMRFWKEWARAFHHEWRIVSQVTEQDWPQMARTIATHVRSGTLPNDRPILDNFVRRKRNLVWSDFTRLLDKSG